MSSDPESAVRQRPPGRRGHLVDLSPLRESAPFARLYLGRSISGIGAQLTLTAAGLNVYDITHSTLSVALVGVIALVPTIAAGLYGGMLADAFDRRLVALVAALVSWAATLTIATLAWTGAQSVWSLYALTAVTAVATTVVGATESAISPRLLAPQLLPAAAALNGITMGVAITLGPALAGVLVAGVGFEWCYTVDAILFVAALSGLGSLPKLPPAGVVDRPGLDSLKSGIAFLRRAPNIRTSFFVDILAMTFGQPRVLFPAVGALLLGGGAITVGILSASIAIGALLCSLFSGRLGGVRRHGVAIERAIQVYGLCVLGFGIVLAVATVANASGWIRGVGPSIAHLDVPLTALSALFLAGSGASDNVSAIYRSTMLQTAAPDAVRGRLQGVFIVVVTGGPRVGDLYVGLLVTLAGMWLEPFLAGVLWLPPLLGGILIVVLVAVLTRANRGFLRYDAASPTP